MKSRFRGIEFEDQPWFPEIIRDNKLDFINPMNCYRWRMNVKVTTIPGFQEKSETNSE